MPGGQGRKEHRTACYARSVVLAATLGSLDMPCALAAAYSIENDRYTLSLPLAIALARLPASRGDRKWFRDGRSVITLRVQEFDKGRGPVGLPPIG